MKRMKRKTDNRSVDGNIAKAWQEASEGTSFIQALAKRGYEIAQGYKHIVTIDPQGKAQNPAWHLEGVTVEDIRKKLGDFNIAALRDAMAVSGDIERRRQEAGRQRLEQRLAQMQNQLQDRQLKESGQRFHQLQTDIEKERKRLFAECQIREQQEGIATLQKFTQQPSLWRRLTGQAEADRAEMKQLRYFLKTSQETVREKVAALEKERERAMEELKKRHQQEKDFLIRHGSAPSEMHSIRNPAHDRSKSRKTDRDFDR